MRYRCPQPDDFDFALSAFFSTSSRQEVARYRLAHFARFVENLTYPCECGEPSVVCFAPVARTRTGEVYLSWMTTACAAPECQQRARDEATHWAGVHGTDWDPPPAEVRVENLVARRTGTRRE